MSMKEIGQISIKKSLYWTILKRAGIYIEKDDVNHSFDNFLLDMNGLLGQYAPFKKVSKYQLKLKNQTLDYSGYS